MEFVYLPKKKEKVSARRLLSEDLQNNKNVKSVRFNPPVVGKKGFGSFEVEYKNPVLRKVLA
ncbi:hypothetical protein KRX19_05450 [Cardiobacteriaceae bacterium TAE3-ERU3]|nr:hypothetical protein [Cardiobacteriaceae bacterium TAE3-ERU3]